jgi:hypothetical protein
MVLKKLIELFVDAPSIVGVTISPVVVKTIVVDYYSLSY